MIALGVTFSRGNFSVHRIISIVMYLPLVCCKKWSPMLAFEHCDGNCFFGVEPKLLLVLLLASPEAFSFQCRVEHSACHYQLYIRPIYLISVHCTNIQYTWASVLLFKNILTIWNYVEYSIEFLMCLKSFEEKEMIGERVARCIFEQLNAYS